MAPGPGKGSSGPASGPRGSHLAGPGAWVPAVAMTKEGLPESLWSDHGPRDARSLALP